MFQKPGIEGELLDRLICARNEMMHISISTERTTHRSEILELLMMIASLHQKIGPN